MKRLKSEKGVITMITLVTVLFMVSFLISSYIIVANKVKTQKEMMAETKSIYEPKTSMEEIYNSYFSNENIIPIYTVEQLLVIGNNQQVNINGKYYKFSNNENSVYVLMNDIELNAIDLGLKNNWVPIYENKDFLGIFEWNGYTIEVTKLNGNIVEYKKPAIILSETQMNEEIAIGSTGTVELTATLNNESKDLTWVSSDTNVAEISGSGNTRTITLKKAGTATITVSYGEVSATCSITITEKEVEKVTWTKTSTGELAIGSTVKTSTNEEFYVIGGDTVGTAITSSTQKIILLAKYNLNLSGTAQVNATYSETACAFSTNRYWTGADDDLNDNDNADGVMAKAKTYGTNLGGTGRLMTHKEASDLLAMNNTDITNIIYGTNGESSNTYLNYWLGSALGTYEVWSVLGEYGSFGDGSFGDDFDHGCRPVVEILKSDI